MKKRLWCVLAAFVLVVSIVMVPDIANTEQGQVRYSHVSRFDYGVQISSGTLFCSGTAQSRNSDTITN